MEVEKDIIDVLKKLSVSPLLTKPRDNLYDEEFRQYDLARIAEILEEAKGRG